MSLIEWHEEFSTGISGVDYEHEILITMINSFYAELTEHSDKDVLINILNDIYGAIYSHFVLEERLMEKHGYDQYREHRDDHARLLDDIRDIAIEFEKTAEYDEQKLKGKLNDWFSIHFKTHDSRLHKLEELIASQEGDGGGFISSIKKGASRFFNNR